MIFFNLDEIFIDRVGHAAKVFGYSPPKGVVFGLEQLRKSVQMSSTEFDNLLDAALPSWEAADHQPWIWRLFDGLEQAAADYRLTGQFQRNADVRRYVDWMVKNMGNAGMRRLVLHSDQYPAPMRPGDTLVAVSESAGNHWVRRNGRFIQWQPYTQDHHQHGTQWQTVLSQMHGQPA